MVANSNLATKITNVFGNTSEQTVIDRYFPPVISFSRNLDHPFHGRFLIWLCCSPKKLSHDVHSWSCVLLDVKTHIFRDENAFTIRRMEQRFRPGMSVQDSLRENRPWLMDTSNPRRKETQLSTLSEVQIDSNDSDAVVPYII